MSYRVTIDGIEIEMDTPEEVFQLLRNSESDATVVGKAIAGTMPDAKVWDARTLIKFLNTIPKGGSQIGIVRILYYGTLDGMAQIELIKELEEIENAQQLGGALSGLAKNADKLGMPSPCEIVTLPRSDGKRVYRYRLSPSCRAAIDTFLKDMEPKNEQKKETTQ